MDVREIVRLKKGAGGLEPPENMGILLDREKSGKDHIAVIFTVKGIVKVKWNSVKDAGGHIYAGDKKDHGAMRDLLRSFIDDERKGLVLKIEPKEIIDGYSPSKIHQKIMGSRDKWKKEGAGSDAIPPYCENIGFSPAAISRMIFDPLKPDPRQISAVASILSRCDDPSLPYFFRFEGNNGPCYSPYSVETIKDIRKNISRLEDLRSRFIDWEEFTDERTGRTVRRAVPGHADPRDAILDGPASRDLDLICEWVRYFLLNGKWKTEGERIFGLASTPASVIDRFDLVDYVWDLAHHMIGAVVRDLPSDLVGMLLSLDRIDQREASEMVVDFNLGSGRRTFHREFPDHVRKSEERLPGEISEDEKEEREDLRGLETYTIDPPDARDFDDAVSIEKTEEGIILWVHIADVSHYVRPGDLIDNEARYRATSVYLPTGVLPMLPEKLSEDLCSLREDTDRLALSTKMVIDHDMRIREHRHFRSVIRVNANLSYDQVEEWIDLGKAPFTELHRVASALETSNERLRLETPERKVRFTGDNEISVSVKRPTRATKMIEQFMVLTNEAAARTLRDNDLAVPYRAHPMPDKESVNRFNETMEGLGLGLDLDLQIAEYDEGEENGGGEEEGSLMEALLAGGKIKMGGMANVPEPEEGEGAGHDEDTATDAGMVTRIPIEAIEETISTYNRTLSRIENEHDGMFSDLLRSLVLRTMPRAFYTTENIGHFGLASDCYCHFTSPIRRYPDILVHRSIKHIMEVKEGIRAVQEPPDSDSIGDMMEHVNEMSDQAEEWEREMIDVALATRIFMDKDSGKRKRGGIISSLTPSMVYASLDDGVTEGSIPIRTLSPLRLHLDDTESRIIASLEGNSEHDPRDPLMKRLIDSGGEEIEVLKIGDRKEFAIHSVSIAQGRIGLSLRDFP